MHDSQTLFHNAIAHHQQGDLREAVAGYRELIVTDDYQSLDARYLLGTALLQLGEFAESVEHLSAVTAARRDVADAQNNLGIAHKATGDWERATRAFEAALKINPEYDQALFNLGSVMEQRSLFADAEKCFRHASRLSPADNGARFALAGVLKAQEKWAGAETCYRGCRAAGFEDSSLDVNLAFVLARQDKLDEAADIYSEILATQPEFAEIHNSLSYINERRGRLDDALASARRAVELQPDYAEGHNNLGIALSSLHRLHEALPAFRRALEIRPDFPLAAFNLGTTHLLAGDYAEGWSGYERRAEALGEQPRRCAGPKWDGSAIAGQRLFVFADQGFGDTIQFSRFLQTATHKSQAKVILECQPELVSLIRNVQGVRNVEGVDAVIADGNPLPDFDTWIPLSSLPGRLGCTVDSIPANTPYLTPEPVLREEPQSVLDTLHAPRKIGVVWRGNPQQARDFVRSCPLEIISPLFDVEDIDWVSLQTGADSDQRLVDIGSQLRDFSETAAVISQLDLVITVDTATAHLAGALGVPVWTLLCHTPDWRWGLNGASCPWYPAMRLFRQSTWGDWAGVVAEVADALK